MRFFIFLKKIFYVFIFIIIILFVFLTPNYIFDINNYKLNLNKYFNDDTNQNVVLELWHVDLFKGGSGDNKKFLEKRAINFNKYNHNCFISVSKMSFEQFKLNWNDGKRADVYSFGKGVGEYLIDELLILDENDEIREEILDCCKVDENLIAYPYSLSSYCLISNESLLKNKMFESIVLVKKEVKGIGFCGYSLLNYEKTLNLCGYNGIKKSDYLNCLTEYDCYLNFLSKKIVSFVGTLSEVNKLKNRETNGKFGSCNYIFLNNYTDLIHCIGISKEINESKLEYAKAFCSYLLDENCQKTLSNYGVLGVLKNKIYQNGFMSEVENNFLNNKNYENVFITLEQNNRLRKDFSARIFI